MAKAILLFLYGATLWITLSKWYETNSGFPDPKVVGPPSYLFGVLAITADFLSGLPIILGAALTFILWQRAYSVSAAPGKKKQATPSTSPTISSALKSSGVTGVNSALNLGMPPAKGTK